MNGYNAPLTGKAKPKDPMYPNKEIIMAKKRKTARKTARRSKRSSARKTKTRRSRRTKRATARK